MTTISHPAPSGLIDLTEWNQAHTGTAMTLVSIPVSAAQVKALDVTPITLVPAPGGRNYVVPWQCIGHFRAGATPFDADLLMSLGWGTTVADVRTFATFELHLFINGVTVDQYARSADDGDYFFSASDIENVPFAIALKAASPPPTVGDGTLTLRFYYDVIDGAP